MARRDRKRKSIASWAWSRSWGGSRCGRGSCRLPASLAGSRKSYSYETVFLLGLAVPAISLTGALLVRLDGAAPKPIDWRILGGGLLFGLTVVAIGLSGLPFGQELIFAISLAVIALMLARIAGDLDEVHRQRIFYAALVIFLYRASPGVGEGYRWFTIDVLGFDEAFYGTLAQIGAALSLAGAWLFSDVITRKPIAKVLLWLTIIGTVLSLPTIGLALRVDQWTEATFGFGARTIALVDTTAAAPFAELSMIPALTIVAINAPAGKRATWFALMASLMNIALVAGQLQTKYLNLLFAVDRGSYADLAALVIVAVTIGFVVPACGHSRLRQAGHVRAYPPFPLHVPIWTGKIWQFQCQICHCYFSQVGLRLESRGIQAEGRSNEEGPVGANDDEIATRHAAKALVRAAGPDATPHCGWGDQPPCRSSRRRRLDPQYADRHARRNRSLARGRRAFRRRDAERHLGQRQERSTQRGPLASPQESAACPHHVHGHDGPAHGVVAAERNRLRAALVCLPGAPAARRPRGPGRCASACEPGHHCRRAGRRDCRGLA